ncbi:MAG: 2-hydroxyacyl-CoA dehydratase [Deltaproteobacteria bacterium]|nr:2-hydroxyacyl-CoA dehydratase [Deltaproteobacteria bacterium]
MRRAYIERQRGEHGRKSVAVLPVHHPKELLTALDLLSVELWGPPGPPRGPDVGRVQSYVCAVARNALAFLAAGHADVVDAVLYPHTCDSIQGLATLIPDFGGCAKPALTFLHPKGPSRPSARTYLEAELRSLAASLEGIAGKELEPERLRAAIALHREIDDTKARVLAGRARLPLADRALYEQLRRGEFLWPEEHLAELRALEARLESAPVQRGVPVMVTGYVPEPMGILDAIDDAGAFVAVDDWAAIGRRVTRAQTFDRAGEPFRALVDLYHAAPPCPTRHADQGARMRHLLDLFDRSGAAGVIVHEPKFCEPELFDVPAIKKTFADRKVPLLYLETELEAELPGQTVTRIEAFVEMLQSSRRAA